MMAGCRWIDGMAELADRYSVFLIDQFGVLHDGTTVYPGVVDCLERLSAGGRSVIILSNSGKRAAPNKARLAALGIAPATYTDLISSGEVAWHALSRREEPWTRTLGRRCLLLSRGDDGAFADGLDIDLVPSVDDADFILMAGSDAPRRSFDDYRPLLEAGAARGLPMICSNPDLRMVTAEGTFFGSGHLAEYYRDLGGTVHWYGKPHPEIYRYGLRGPEPTAAAVAIGDSLAHDIVGGRAAGIATAFVAGGIHADVPHTDLEELYREYGVTPDWSMPAFQW